MQNKELKQNAQELIEAKLGRGEPVSVAGAVTELINGQGRISGTGFDFYTLCAHEHVHRVVKEVVGDYESPRAEDAKQMKLEGFDHLKVAYTVERDGERVLVPTDHCTSEELLARASEFDRLAEGLQAHAEEIRRYVANRNEQLPPRKRRGAPKKRRALAR